MEYLLFEDVALEFIENVASLEVASGDGGGVSVALGVLVEVEGLLVAELLAIVLVCI